MSIKITRSCVINVITPIATIGCAVGAALVTSKVMLIALVVFAAIGTVICITKLIKACKNRSQEIKPPNNTVSINEEEKIQNISSINEEEKIQIEEKFKIIEEESQEAVEGKMPKDQVRLKIEKAFKTIYETGKYYVFLHAMDVGLGFYMDIIDIFREVDENNPYDKKIRLEIGEKESLAQIQKRVDEQADNNLKGLVMSVDGNLKNERAAESAWSMFNSNSSMALNTSDGKNQRTNFKEKFSSLISKKLQIQNEKIKEQFENKLTDAYQTTRFLTQDNCGRMTLFAIKKEVMEDEKRRYTYSSHPFGRSCHCHSKTKKTNKITVENTQSFLEKLEKNQKGENGTCTESENTINQYRIVANQLEGDKEKAVFNFNVRTPTMKESAEKVINAVKEMIQSIREANGNEELIQNAILSCAI